MPFGSKPPFVKRPGPTAAEIVSKLSDERFTHTGVVTPVPPAPTDAVAVSMAATAAKILNPDAANRIVERLLTLEAPFDLRHLNPTKEGALEHHELLTHPTFIRAGARRATAFYLGPEGSVHRFTLDGEFKSDLLKVESKAESQPMDDFYLPPPWLDDLRMFVLRGETTLLIGPAGCGKTEATEQVFKARKQPLHIVSCTPSMTADDMEGRSDLVGGDTKFTLAAPAVALRDGHGILFDEADACPAETLYALYRMLSGKDMRIVRMGGDGIVPRHADFRAVGTQNTQGRGDDRGLHHGRAYQDEAFLDRWQNTIKVDYPTQEQEVLILRKRTGVSAHNAEQIVKSSGALRKAMASDEILFSCSIRRSIAVATNIVSGMTPERAWQFALLNRVTTEDAAKTLEVLNRIYGDKLKKAPS